MWKWRSAIIAIASLVGVLTFFGSQLLIAKQFSSKGLVRISANAGASSQDGVLASNSLASQYAVLASSGPVLRRAEKALALPPGELEGHVSSGTVGQENLIQIAVSASDAEQSRVRAEAVSTAFIAEMESANGAQSATFQREVEARLTPLDAQIARVRAQLASFPGFSAAAPTSGALAAQQASLQASLASLVSQRDQVLASVTDTSAALQPALSVWAQPGTGGQTQPKPRLYALAAFVIAFLVVAQIVVIFEVRRR